MPDFVGGCALHNIFHSSQEPNLVAVTKNRWPPV